MTKLDPVTTWTGARCQRLMAKHGLGNAAVAALTGLPLQHIENVLAGNAPAPLPLAVFLRLFGAASRDTRARIMAAVVAQPVTSIEWRPIAGYDAYEVSSQGIIRRHGRELRQTEARTGHLRVTLYNGKREGGARGWRVQVHKIVALTFLGPAPPDKPVVRHRNGRPFDNRPENLVWGTHGENAVDRGFHQRHGKERVDFPWIPRRRIATKGKRVARSAA